MRKIFIYTACYPFAKTTESYLTAELNVVANDYDITIVPIKKEQYVRPLNSRVKLDCGLREMSVWKCGLAFCKALNPKYLWPALNEACKLGGMKYMIDALKYLYAINKVSIDLEKRADIQEKSVFYCYWLSFVPVTFALYKKKHPETKHKFVSRGHGSDIYATLQGVYYPLREFGLKYIDAVYTVSEFGAKFLQERYPAYASKIHVSRLGIPSIRDHVMDNSSIVRILSVSSVYPFKRVSLLYNSIFSYAISHPEKNVEWIHCGDGGLFENLKKDISNNIDIPNLRVILKGRITNEEVLDLYRHTNISAYALLSTSEGVPVSIMESIASCTPVIACDAGGVREIVNDETGCLLPKEFTQKDFDSALDYVIKNNKQLSVSSYNYYKNNYSDQNFIEFYKQICSL